MPAGRGELTVSPARKCLHHNPDPPELRERHEGRQFEFMNTSVLRTETQKLLSTADYIDDVMEISADSVQ